MSWASLANNQWITYADLQDAVDTGVFVLRSDQSLPTTPGWITRVGIPIWLYAMIDSTGWPAILTDDAWIQKSWVKPTSIPVVVTEIDDLGSPSQIFYNPNDELMYYLETDSMGFVPAVVGGAIGYFDPLTAVTYADITYADIGHGANYGVMHVENNKLYASGYQSGGLSILDCATKTSALISFGGATSSSRGNVYRIGNYIYTSFADIDGFVVVDAATDTRIDDFIPPGSSAFSDFLLVEVAGAKVWVFYSGSTTTAAFASLFNIADIVAPGTPVPLATINNLSTATNRNGVYNIPNAKLDFSGDKIWFVAVGEKVIRSISNTTLAIADNIAMTSLNPYANFEMLLYPQANNVYASGAFGNGSSDNVEPYTYLINTVDGTIFQSYPATTFRGDFVYAPPVDRSYGTLPGNYVYSVPNTDYNVDGSVQVY